jgi:2-hydroxy-3-keto-5-methylthiopentenyl-1-phosphate phosphatase
LTARSHRPGTDKGTAIREPIGDETAAVFYAGDDVGDLPAVEEVNAWAGRSGCCTGSAWA